MDEPRLLMPGGGADTPGGYVRLALLVMALTVSSLAGAFLVVLRPLPLHQVAVDLRYDPCGGPLAGYDRLDIGVDGSIALNGEPQADLVSLRMQLELLMVRRERPVLLNPHPDARYEIMIEVLAIMKRANTPRIRLACAEAPILHPGEAGWMSIDEIEARGPVRVLPIDR